MNTAAFLHYIEQNAARVQEYRLGGDGSGGKCDCIGLIIGAVRLAGGAWTGTHGSNYAARSRVKQLHAVESVSQLKAGEMVFKGRQPGDQSYSLPGRYKTSGDVTDYYHVGVVTRLSPLQITHCTGIPGGIKRDTALGAWRYAGTLDVLEEENMSVLYQATVTAENGRPVNFRASPGTSGRLLRTLPVGTRVDVLEECGDWLRICYEGAEGYMMRAYLHAGSGDTVTVSRAALQGIYDTLRDMLA